MRTTRPILTLLPALLLLAACGEQKAAVEEKFNSEFISSFSKACVESIPENTRISSEQKQQVCQCAAEKALEVLTPADYTNHIDKWKFTVPFVCGATNLGEALRRINEGAAMIRSKGEAGTGDVSEAMKHIRKIRGEVAALTALPKDELFVAAKELQAPYELVACERHEIQPHMPLLRIRLAQLIGVLRRQRRVPVDRSEF